MVRRDSELVYGYIIYILMTLFLIFFSLIAMMGVWYRKKSVSGHVLLNDLDTLGRIFTRINKTAGIASFDHQKNWINFLQIKKDGFVGSEVGSMNLIYPDKWEGPYLDDNPTYNGREYQVIRTDQGYFIVPGKGVTLPNGKTIDKDIILDEKADMFALMKDPNGLEFDGKPVVLKIRVGKQKGSVAVPQ